MSKIRKQSQEQTALVTEVIEQKIYLIHGQKVILDRDLAQIYGVPTSRFNQAAKRNCSRFPDDFMFRLTEEEWRGLTSQIGVGLIKSVDDACHCKLIFDVIESRLLSTSEAIEDWKRNDFVGVSRE